MGWLGWSLLSALFAGITALTAKVGVRNVDANLATAIRTTVVLVGTWAIVLLSPGRAVNVSSRAMLFLVISGIATGASWLCYFKALQIGDVSKVAPIDKLSVVIAIVLGAVILRETISWQHWLGGILIVAGAVLVAFR